MSLDQQLATQAELDEIFSFVSLCEFKNEKLAALGETTVSRNNASLFVDYLYNIQNRNGVSKYTDSERESFIDAYEEKTQYGTAENPTHGGAGAEYNPYYYTLRVAKDIKFSVSRVAKDFELIKEPSVSNTSQMSYFKKTYAECLRYMYATVYVKGMEYETNYREFFLSSTIMMAILKVLNQKFKTPLDTNIMDTYTIDRFLNSFGMPFFKDINIKYKRLILQNINKLITNKGTNECFLDILSIFDFSNIEIYEYHLIAKESNPINKATNISENARFYRINVKEKSLNYAIRTQNYSVETFNTTVSGDEFWEASKAEVESLNFHDAPSKYISVDSNYDLYKVSKDTTLILNYIKDIAKDYGSLNRMVFTSSAIDETGNDISVADLIVSMNILLCQLYGIPTTIQATTIGSIDPNKKVDGFATTLADFNSSGSTTDDLINYTSTVVENGFPIKDKQVALLNVDNQNVTPTRLNDYLNRNFLAKENLEAEIIAVGNDYPTYIKLKKAYDKKFTRVLDNTALGFTDQLTYIHGANIHLYNKIMAANTDLLKVDTLDMFVDILTEVLNNVNKSIILNGDSLIRLADVVRQVVSVFKSYTVTLKDLTVKIKLKENFEFRFRENRASRSHTGSTDSITMSDAFIPLGNDNNLNDVDILIFAETLIGRDVTI